MNKLKSVVIPCTAQEFQNIVEPTLRQYGYTCVSVFNDFESFDCGVMIYEDGTYSVISETSYTLRPKSYTRFLITDLQTHHPLYTYATVHAQHVDDAVEILRDLFTLEVDGNELRLPNNYQESAAAMLFDALIPVVFSSETCKSKQR
jgi:hypothetical protein